MNDPLEEIEESYYDTTCDPEIELSPKAIEYLISEVKQLRVESDKYKYALQRIDCHIRSTPEPIPYIVETLKRTLNEYKEDNTND
jgi:hypothetical protein